MNIGVIGLGKLGCSMFAAFAASGNKVFGFDINTKARNNLRNKIAPVYETDLQKEINLGFDNFKIILFLSSKSHLLESKKVYFLIISNGSIKC